LLTLGADKTIRGESNLTALEFAEKQGVIANMMELKKSLN